MRGQSSNIDEELRILEMCIELHWPKWVLLRHRSWERELLWEMVMEQRKAAKEKKS